MRRPIELSTKWRAAAAIAMGHVAIAACAGDDSNPYPPPPADAGPSDATIAAHDGAGIEASADAPLDVFPPIANASLRFAALAPDAPAIDFCIAPHGTGAFAGPIVASSSVADGGLVTLAFPSMSAYRAIAPGTYDARVVPGGATDCAIGVAADATLPPLAAGSFATIALLGVAHPTTGEPSLTITALLDDGNAPSGVALRFVHAAPSAPVVDVGSGSVAIAFKPWFEGVAFGLIAGWPDGGAPDGATPIDARGYASLKALAGVTVTAHAIDADADLASGTVSAAAGSILTVALVDGTGADGGAAERFFACVDNAGVVGALASCALLAP